MRIVKRIAVIAFLTLSHISCGGGTSNQPPNAEGFATIEQSLKDKFGSNAYYTDLSIFHDRSIGNSIGLTVTDAPESLKMGEYVYSNHTSWKQTSEIRLELPEGSQATHFMFQLNEKINLRKLGELVELSTKKLTEEKGIDNPNLALAFIKFPKNGNLENTHYVVNLEPENGGTTFSFNYALNGEFIELNY